MKEAIGATMMFNIVIFFILLFTGIMCMTINRARAFQVKDVIVTIIEENDGIVMDRTLNYGVSNDVLEEIVDAVTTAEYRTTGTCPDDYIGIDRTGGLDIVNPVICIAKTDAELTLGNAATGNYDFVLGDLSKGCYFSIIVFYKLDIPVMNDLFTFSTKGETKVMLSDKCD